MADLWIAHTGEDYSVVMRSSQNTETALIHTNDAELSQQIADLLNRADGKVDEYTLAEAITLHASDVIQIDSDAAVSHADNGTWVQAWVWVPGEQDGRGDQ
jgi:hypothetical protein